MESPLLSLLLLLLLLTPLAASGEDRRILIVDAGSTGTRAFAFHFSDNSSWALGCKLEKFATESVGTALSSFANYPKKAGAMVGKLVDLLSKNWARDETVVLLRATAGLRLMESAARRRLLASVRKVLDYVNHRTRVGNYSSASHVRMLSGNEEAKFSWLSANYVTGRLSANSQLRTQAVLGLGGGSAQFAAQIASEVGADEVLQLPDGRRVPLRLRSFLGEGWKAALLRAAGHGAGQRQLQTPCLARGFDANFTFGDAGVRLLGDQGLDDSLRLAACQRRLRPLPRSEVDGVGVGVDGGSFFGVGAAYYYAKYVGEKAKAAKAAAGRVPCVNASCDQFQLPLWELRRATEEICQRPPSEGSYEPYYCFGFLLLQRLARGAGFEPDARMLGIRQKRKLLNWSLGCALHYLRLRRQ